MPRALRIRCPPECVDRLRLPYAEAAEILGRGFPPGIRRSPDCEADLLVGAQGAHRANHELKPGSLALDQMGPR